MRTRLDKTRTWNDDRIVVSFRIDKELWIEFDNHITEKFGNYKKSMLIEDIIRKYMVKKKNED